jgi:ribose 5-phosphate isomerase B
MEAKGHTVTIHVPEDGKTCDYPEPAYQVASAVIAGRAERGILLCGTGIGMCIAANKIKGVRAAVVHDELTAELSRSHNDANVLCLSADLLGQRLIEKIVETWLHREFEAGRHERRIRKIHAIEEGQDPSAVEA